MEKIFSTTIAAAAILAAASLFYHFVLFLPMAHEQDMRRADQMRVTEISRRSAAEMMKVRCKASARKDCRRALVLSSPAETTISEFRRMPVMVELSSLRSSDSMAHLTAVCSRFRRSSACFT